MWTQILKSIGYIVRRFSEKTPTNYFRLITQGTLISVTRFQGKQAIDHAELMINDGQFQALNTLLNSFPSYPVYVVLKDESPHFHLVSLAAARWWHRPVLLRQAKAGEFLKTSWVHTQFIPSTQDAHRYLLAGVSPSPFLQVLVDNLKHLSNPVVGIQLWPIVFADHVFKTLEKQKDQADAHEWSLILYQHNSDDWQLIVCHNQAVILNRGGQLPTESAMLFLTKEVTSTMRYLNRHNYHQGDPVTLIQIGFEETLKFKKFPQLKVVDLKEDPTENLPILSPFQVSELWAHHLAFVLTQKLVKAAMPIGFCLFAASSILFFNAHFQQQNHSLLLQQQLSLKLPEASYEHLRLSQLFQAYQSIQSSDPIPMLRQLRKILPPYAVATDLQWTAQTPKTGLSELNLNLVLDKQSLSRKNPADSTVKSLQLYQEKAQQSFHRFHPTSQLSWGKISNDFKCSLKITYPSKKLTS